MRLPAPFPSTLVGAGFVGAGCGPGPVVGGPPLDLSGQDPELVELVRSVEAARARVSAEPGDSEAELAAVLDANELDEPAEEARGQVVALDPGLAVGWYHLARVRERRGRIEGALAALERVRALELDPTAPAIALTFTRLELLRGSPEAAIARLEPLRARLPREPYVNGLLARAWSARGDTAASDPRVHVGSERREPWSV